MENKLKSGKITAKLRDAVQNIEIPDSFKELEMLDIHFNVRMDGKITFEIHFEEGVLPEVFPEPRTRMTRAAKAKAKAQTAPEFDEPEEIPEEPAEAASEEAPAKEPATMELHYNVTGIPRKELVVAVSGFVGMEPVYKAAPSFAYAIDNYIIDKEGALTGPANPALIAALSEQGYTAAE